MAPDPVVQRRLDHMWELHGDELITLADECRGRELPATGNLPLGHTQGCGGRCRIEYRYFNEQEELAPIRLCAVCDRAYDMPRFL